MERRAEAVTACGGGTTLRMSADGKTAGGWELGPTEKRVYDVATGRQLMRFPGKK